MKRLFHVLSPIKFNGTLYRCGDEIDLIDDPAEAKRLAEIRAVTPRDLESGPARNGQPDPDQAALRELLSKGRLEGELDAPSPDVPDPAAVKAAIREVIPTLAAEDFTKSGDKAPRVAAVEARLAERFTAEEITAELVAEAWAEHRAETPAES